MATELANRRTFYAIVQAEFRDSIELFAFRESLTILGGGGPKFHYNPSLVGVPQIQITNIATTVKYIQRGRAIGRVNYPVASDPLWPTIVHNDQNQLTYE